MYILQELEAEWERQQGEEQLLRNQLKKVQDDLRRVNAHLEKGQGERAVLEEKIGTKNINAHLKPQGYFHLVTSSI